jgi:hypothetical protein
MKLIILMLLLLVGVIISKCRCRVVEGLRRKTKSNDNDNDNDNDNIAYAQNELESGADSLYWLTADITNELSFTGNDILFYVCGNASGLFSHTEGQFEWSSNVCDRNDCKLPRCNEGDDSCIQARNNSPVRIGTYCAKYDESGGSHTLNSNYESYINQFISCPNEGDKIYGLHKLVYDDNDDNVLYHFLPHNNNTKYGLCSNGVINVYQGQFPEGSYSSGDTYEASHGSGTAFTCEPDTSEKTPCNRKTDRLKQILT